MKYLNPLFSKKGDYKKNDNFNFSVEFFFEASKKKEFEAAEEKINYLFFIGYEKTIRRCGLSFFLWKREFKFFISQKRRFFSNIKNPNVFLFL